MPVTFGTVQLVPAPTAPGGTQPAPAPGAPPPAPDARDLGPLNLSLNLTGEREFLPGGGSEVELGGALGASLELLPAIRLGAEVYGNRSRAEGAAWESAAWAGPALSIAALRGWLVLAAGFGLTAESEKVRARAILAWQL